MEDDADADGLEQVGAGLIGDAGDGADAELEDADIHEGQDFQIEAGEALVGDTVVDDDAAVLEREGSVEAGARGTATVGAGEADGALEIRGEELIAGGEGGTEAAHGGVEATAGSGGGGVGAVAGGGDGAAEVDTEADVADVAEVVVGAADAADGGEGSVGFGDEGVGGAVADGRVGQAAEVLSGDHAVDGALGVGEGSKGEGQDGEERGLSKIHAAVSLEQFS